jgi:hypothetical protein
MDGTYACGTISFYFSSLVICYLLYFNLLFYIFSYIRIYFVWKNKQNQTQITKINKLQHILYGSFWFNIFIFRSILPMNAITTYFQTGKTCSTIEALIALLPLHHAPFSHILSFLYVIQYIRITDQSVNLFFEIWIFDANE